MLKFSRISKTQLGNTSFTKTSLFHGAEATEEYLGENLW